MSEQSQSTTEQYSGTRIRTVPWVKGLVEVFDVIDGEEIVTGAAIEVK